MAIFPTCSRQVATPSTTSGWFPRGRKTERTERPCPGRSRSPPSSCWGPGSRGAWRETWARARTGRRRRRGSTSGRRSVSPATSSRTECPRWARWTGRWGRGGGRRAGWTPRGSWTARWTGPPGTRGATTGSTATRTRRPVTDSDVPEELPASEKKKKHEKNDWKVRTSWHRR